MNPVAFPLPCLNHIDKLYSVFKTLEIAFWRQVNRKLKSPRRLGVCWYWTAGFDYVDEHDVVCCLHSYRNEISTSNHYTTNKCYCLWTKAVICCTSVKIVYLWTIIPTTTTTATTKDCFQTRLLLTRWFNHEGKGFVIHKERCLHRLNLFFIMSDRKEEIRLVLAHGRYTATS